MRFPDNRHDSRPQISDLQVLGLPDFAQILQTGGPSLLVSDTFGPVEDGPIGPFRTCSGARGSGDQSYGQRVPVNATRETHAAGFRERERHLRRDRETYNVRITSE
jgi:hypothetical protein